MSRLTRDGTAESVSRDQILRHERGQGNIHFPCSADHVQDWQPYPVDPYSIHTLAICVTIHTYTVSQFLENGCETVAITREILSIQQKSCYRTVRYGHPPLPLSCQRFTILISGIKHNCKLLPKNKMSNLLFV